MNDIDASVLEKSNNYVNKHREYVKKAFELLEPKLISMYNLSQDQVELISQNIQAHDLSKFQPDEATAYAEFFWGERDSRVIRNFQVATELHKSRNPHHPEYWMNDNGETNKMPFVYIVEMICDWWSFGLMQNCPAKIFNFYENNQDKYKFSKEITNNIEKLLAIISQTIIK